VTRRAISLFRLFAAVVFFCVSASAYSLGLRCGNRIVGTGMISAQVRNACGSPFWADNYVSLEILGAGGPVEEQREVNWEVWYYNFGSSMFMQRLSFRDGQLQKVEALGYGVDEIGTACVRPIASRGLTSGELVARCGEPSSRQRSEGAFVRRVPGALFANEDRREEWLYDDGSGYLTRYFLTNSQVTGAERLPR
jgi:hypothetical protein